MTKQQYECQASGNLLNPSVATELVPNDRANAKIYLLQIRTSGLVTSRKAPPDSTACAPVAIFADQEIDEIPDSSQGDVNLPQQVLWN